MSGWTSGLGRWGHRRRRWHLAEAQVAGASAAPVGANQAGFGVELVAGGAEALAR
jgi:hypothetical protein